MKGKRQVKECILSIWDMDCVLVPFRGWMGKTGARWNCLCQELQCCWDFYTQNVPVCIDNGPPSKRHPTNLTQLWEALESTCASMPPCGTLSTTCRVHALTNWGCSEGKKGGVQLNIRKVLLLMLCRLSVYIYIYIYIHSWSRKFTYSLAKYIQNQFFNSWHLIWVKIPCFRSVRITTLF